MRQEHGQDAVEEACEGLVLLHEQVCDPVVGQYSLICFAKWLTNGRAGVTLLLLLLSANIIDSLVCY